jgi:hypothetical protein
MKISLIADLPESTFIVGTGFWFTAPTKELSILISHLRVVDEGKLSKYQKPLIGLFSRSSLEDEYPLESAAPEFHPSVSAPLFTSHGSFSQHWLDYQVRGIVSRRYEASNIFLSASKDVLTCQRAKRIM